MLVPPGTYGLLRSASGKVEAHLFFSYGGKAPVAPQIRAELPGSGLPVGSDLYFTASGSGAVSYRALAKPLADRSGVIVVAVPLTDVDSTLRHLLLIELIVSGLVLIGLGMLSWIMVRRDLRPLQEITQTAGAIAQGDLSQRVSQVADGTEVGQLGKAFNTMVDEIEVAFADRAASEDRLRRFLADASHELRTPLTAIRGHAELFDLGTRDRPEELAASLHYIQDEAARMGTLVDDLFLLAQLDRQRPLRIEPVDLADLVRRSVAGIGASAPDRRVDVDAVDAMVIDGDEHRIRQVVDNLLVNAVAHTPNGVAPSGYGLPARATALSSPSTTTDRASTRPTPRRSFSRSSGPTPRGRVRQEVRASGSPSWPPSWLPIMGRSGPFPDRGPPSRCGSPSGARAGRELALSWGAGIQPGWCGPAA